MSDFTHLHVHSHYSLLDGLGKIDELLDRTKELGMDSLALTDHGVMYGIVEFVQAAKTRGIKPIVGVEAYVAPGGHTNKRGKIDANPRHLTVLAQNNQGYKNLLQLTTKAHLAGYYYRPRIDYDLLTQHRQGLIILSGCLNSDLSQAILDNRTSDVKRLLDWHIKWFGPDRFFLEIQDHPNIPEQTRLNRELISLSQQYKLPLVATADVHYIRSDDRQAQDVLICVQTGKTVQDKDRLRMIDEDFSLKSPSEVAKAWSDHPQALANTQLIAKMCQVNIEFGVNHLPRFPLPAGTSADAALRQLCEQGMAGRYGRSPSLEVIQRLDYELSVIQKTGFASYFLIVADFVNEAKRRGILVGPGRGSAAGSIVSYLTGITNIDPLKYNLLFERFLNPDRVSMPDIDLDFADDRRDEVIEYVRAKYGYEHVAQIITFGTMAARAAVRDTGRALGFPYSFCDSLAKTIPPFMTFEQALEQSSELRDRYQSDPQAKRLIDTARKLEGVCRHASTHAAGVVITDEPLTNYVPLQLSPTSDGQHDTVTQYAMGPIEALGLLKMDFLGLKNLTVIQAATDRIKQRHNRTINVDKLPLDDPATYRLLQEGKTTGVFQLESSGMKRYLRELKPTEFEDIISILALYRPGPMESIPNFIAAKHGRRKITYLHPILQPILEKTYGVIVTQDQVLQIAREFAGFSYAEADILRKAVGKKIKKLLIEQREKFIQGAIDNKGIDSQTAKQVWDFIEPFARYGFNRAHAACYAMIAYQTAYLKANWPADFMAALLTSDEGNIDRQAIEVGEAMSMDLAILPPDVNQSEENFAVVQTADGKDAIRWGLGGIKNIGHNVVTAIITQRKQGGRYQDLSDLFRRVNCKDLNRKSVESLARAGAFDSLAERNQVLGNIEALLDFNRALFRQHDAGQQNLFGTVSASLAPPRLSLRPAPAASKEQRLAWEKELLGMYVSEHPLQDLQSQLRQVTTPLIELTDMAANQRVRVAGVITQLRKHITKNQQPMLFVGLEDLGGKTEVLVFPSVLTETQDVWQDGRGVIVTGRVSNKDGERKILADQAWPLTQENLSNLPRQAPLRRQPALTTHVVRIYLPTGLAKAKLEQLRRVLARHHSDSKGLPVELMIPRRGSIIRLKTTYRLPKNDSTTTAVKKIIGQHAIRYS